MIDAGRLNRRATLLRRDLAAPDASGEKLPVWTAIATVWAERRDLSGRELVASGREMSEATCRFVIRWRAGLTPIHRIDCEGVSYDVTHLAELGRRVGLELTCRTVA